MKEKDAVTNAITKGITILGTGIVRQQHRPHKRSDAGWAAAIRVSNDAVDARALDQRMKE